MTLPMRWAKTAPSIGTAAGGAAAGMPLVDAATEARDDDPRL
jgi:hypothetical protein